MPGLADVADRVFTSDDIMRIPERPRRLVILGGGYIAAEFAHVFSGLGTDVTLINRSDVMLRSHDREIAEQFTSLLSKRVRVRLNQRLASVEEAGDGSITVVTADRNGVEYEYAADAILMAVGRQRNFEALNLSAAGIDVNADGQIHVDAQQRTNVPGVWALGDISSDHLLKHVANAEMRTVQHNLLYPDRLVETDHRYVPHAVFSDPQIAAVGATEEQLKAWGATYVAARQRFADVAYGWALEDDGHYVKPLADPVPGTCWGAHHRFWRRLSSSR